MKKSKYYPFPPDMCRCLCDRCIFLGIHVRHKMPHYTKEEQLLKDSETSWAYCSGKRGSKTLYIQKKGGIMADTFRKVYTALTDAQKAEMEAIKTKAEELETLLNASLQREPRLMALAKTHLENAIMWAIKAVTTSEQK